MFSFSLSPSVLHVLCLQHLTASRTSKSQSFSLLRLIISPYNAFQLWTPTGDLRGVLRQRQDLDTPWTFRVNRYNTTRSNIQHYVQQNAWHRAFFIGKARSIWRGALFMSHDLPRPQFFLSVTRQLQKKYLRPPCVFELLRYTHSPPCRCTQAGA